MAESTRHREAFEVYWRLGSQRSIERLQPALTAKQGHSPSKRTLYEWSRRFQWQTRIARLEHEARVAEDEVRVAEIREMEQRHATTGVFLQQTGLEWLSAMGLGDVTVDAAAKIVIEGVKLERLARGEATERKEVKNEIEAKLAEVSDEELDRLIEYARGAMGGEGEASSG